MDNYSSHISLRVSNLGRENDVVRPTIHPHTSHKLQPLDRTVFGPSKQYYSRALDNWMRNHRGVCFQCDIEHVFAE